MSLNRSVNVCGVGDGEEDGDGSESGDEEASRVERI